MQRYVIGTVCLLAGLLASPAHAAQSKVTSIGEDTYSITSRAKSGFTRDTEKYKAQALADAEKFCAEKGKKLKVVEVTVHKPKFYTESIASATLVFKALDANDPEFQAATLPTAAQVMDTPAANGDLYSELLKLDDLRKRGILTEEEFQSEKKKALDRAR